MNDFTAIISKNDKKSQELDLASNALFSDIYLQIQSAIVDITTLTQPQRLELLKGPKVNVFVGNTLMRSGVPKRALMVSVDKRSHSILKDPRRTTICLPAGLVDIPAMKLVLDALTTNKGIGKAECHPVSTGKTFIEGVYIYKAGLVLGAGKNVEHVLKRLRYLISSSLVSYPELDTILKCVPPTNPLFVHVANDLAHRRYKKTIPDVAEFEEYLEKRKALQKAMKEIDADHQMKRNVRKEEKRDAHKEEKRKVDKEARQAISDVRKEKVRALIEKLDKISSGITMLTAEEAELKRELGI
ncbi:hypothetical protein K505DRAFT_394803 [Melanomma pulvis-pyrius CBS 109.77]|uniref:Uncharacterized protein n=1 Tax=Melanomma pulvis-pyrius CBS 109.77 TaxID=1314802 RepID=A0A6A6WWP8_9PLEO|nr:hypothetical protein K505DRAFT_394803 [Melanomma pulvis-pyrius CBS 109.77]